MGEGITVRTMKDDIADLKGRPSSPVTKNEKSPKKELKPIPGKNPAKKGVIIGAIVLIGIAAGTGWVGYSQFAGKGFSNLLSSPSLPITDVIPADALAVVAYNASSDSNRSVITSYWAQKDESSSTIKDANPTDILSSSDAQGVYYFVLANNSTPFIVLQKTEKVTKYLNEAKDIKYVEKGGWYIAHQISVEDYNVDIQKGAYTGTQNAGLVTDSAFVARYIINSSIVPQILSLPQNLNINRQQIVFDLNQSSPDGQVDGSYTISETAVPERVTPDTTQLTALIPGDASFLRVGDNFSTDITQFQQTHPIFDVRAFAQPAVQQFLAKLTTPYAIYSRVGADGVPDTGLIIQLPDGLKAHSSNSQPIIEQLLTSFSPFVTGRALDAQVVFADGAYNAIPIRYANLEGQTASLDYTIGDNFILITSSREGMQALGAMALGAGDSMLSSTPWDSLLQKAESFVPYDMVAGNITEPAILSLIPGGQSSTQASVIVSTKQDNTGIHTHATVEFTK